jgi:hypothetical protein
MNANHAAGSPSISPELRAGTRRFLQWGSGATVKGQARPAAPDVRQLAKGETTWSVNALGRVVRCESGVFWLCFDGDPKDIVLEAGQTYRCDKGTPLSIHALDAGVVCLV